MEPYTELVRVPCRRQVRPRGFRQRWFLQHDCPDLLQARARGSRGVRNPTGERGTQSDGSDYPAHTVAEKTVEMVPVTTCRVVSDVVRIKVPRLVFRTVPKTLVYKKAVASCEEIPVTVYQPVFKMVPAVEPSPQGMPSSQAAKIPSNQSDMIAD